MPTSLAEAALGPIDLSRPMIDNHDNTFSTEKTISFGIDGGRQVLIPTIVGGKQYKPDEAIALWHQGKNPEFGIYNSVDEAVAAGRARTAEIGRLRGDEFRRSR